MIPSERLAIRRLAAGPVNRETIDAFIARQGFPIVEGTSITFVWRGEAEHVYLRNWIFGMPSSQALTRMPHSDLWYVTLEIPEKSRVEYKFEIQRNGHRELVEDSLNPFRASDPFGANSVAHTAGYEVPFWTRPDPEARTGLLDEIVVESKSFGDRRRVKLYLPARFRRSRTYPLLIVHDGNDYLRYAGMQVVCSTT